ncbi:hypothetical protein LCGC14_2443170 [marine sediment metagenome]|uniref:Uncharacterized protein n=1 Tax=marine sediment metagenome TaxID=412755 RepID=A0A0F9BIK5_9ZZZZ
MVNSEARIGNPSPIDETRLIKAGNTHLPYLFPIYWFALLLLCKAIQIGTSGT